MFAPTGVFPVRDELVDLWGFAHVKLVVRNGNALS